MIGIGCDIEEIDRFESKVNDEEFLKTVYTAAEIAYCQAKFFPAQHFAVRWCAKEAVMKALAMMNIVSVPYSDIEVIRDEYPVPRIEVKNHPRLRILVSLSHCNRYAIAQVYIKRAFGFGPSRRKA